MNEWNHEEREALEGLRDVEPPAEVGRAIRRALREGGHMHDDSRTGGRVPRAIGTLVAAATLIAVGFVAGRAGGGATAPPDAAPDARPKYVLLLHEFAEGRVPDKVEEELVSEYRDWGNALGGRGELVGGWKLRDDGQILNEAPDRPRSDFVFRPGESLGGLFIVRAEDYAGAVRLAESSPHAKYGGTIEVREVAR